MVCSPPKNAFSSCPSTSHLMNFRFRKISSVMASSLVTCTSSIASVLRRRASSSVALPSAYPLPGQVHAAVGIRQGDIHHAKVTPIKSRFLALDAVAHLRLWFECDHAARTSNRAHHPETINSLVCPDIQHGRAAQSEAHHCLDLQPFCSKAITQASNQKMCIVCECRSRDYIIHFVDSAESSSPSGDKLVMLRRIIRTITLEHMPLCFAPQKSRSVHRRRKEHPGARVQSESPEEEDCHIWKSKINVRACGGPRYHGSLVTERRRRAVRKRNRQRLRASETAEMMTTRGGLRALNRDVESVFKSY
jgi:hypothetical protein